MRGGLASAVVATIVTLTGCLDLWIGRCEPDTTAHWSDTGLYLHLRNQSVFPAESVAPTPGFAWMPPDALPNWTGYTLLRIHRDFGINIIYRNASPAGAWYVEPDGKVRTLKLAGRTGPHHAEPPERADLDVFLDTLTDAGAEDRRRAWEEFLSSRIDETARVDEEIRWSRYTVQLPALTRLPSLLDTILDDYSTTLRDNGPNHRVAVRGAWGLSLEPPQLRIRPHTSDGTFDLTVGANDQAMLQVPTRFSQDSQALKDWTRRTLEATGFTPTLTGWDYDEGC